MKMTSDVSGPSPNHRQTVGSFFMVGGGGGGGGGGGWGGGLSKSVGHRSANDKKF